MVESRFLVAHSPDGTRAVWVRFTTRQMRSGPVNEVWCTVFAPQQHASSRWLAAWNGQWSGTDAQSRFALTITPILEAFALIPGPRVLGRYPKQRAATPVPNGLVHGEVHTALGAWSLDGWLGSCGHNTGEQWSSDYTWAQAPFAGGWFEMASSRLRIGPFRTPPLTLAALHIGGTLQRFDRLRQPRLHLTQHALTMLADNGAGELLVKIFGRDFVALDYVQPSGAVAPVRNDSRADLELRWAPRGGAVQELGVRGGAILEFGDR